MQNWQLDLLLFVTLFFCSSSMAGDLTELPKTQIEFKERINQFIVPGSVTFASTRLLEMNNFKCIYAKENLNKAVCIRREPGESPISQMAYIVRMQARDGMITAIESTLEFENK